MNKIKNFIPRSLLLLDMGGGMIHKRHHSLDILIGWLEDESTSARLLFSAATATIYPSQQGASPYLPIRALILFVKTHCSVPWALFTGTSFIREQRFGGHSTSSLAVIEAWIPSPLQKIGLFQLTISHHSSQKAPLFLSRRHSPQ